MSSFRLSQKQNDTALATHVWENGLNPSPKIEWRTVGTRKPVQPKGNCGLCIFEKITIMRSQPLVEMGFPRHLVSLIANLYEDQKATKMEW